MVYPAGIAAVSLCRQVCRCSRGGERGNKSETGAGFGSDRPRQEINGREVRQCLDVSSTLLPVAVLSLGGGGGGHVPKSDAGQKATCIKCCHSRAACITTTTTVVTDGTRGQVPM